MNSPLILIVLDGWGHTETPSSNAIAQANTPNWDKILANNPHTLISGSGLDVGLPEGQMGNSEVGHMTMGAGRVIYQDLTLINKAIADKSFFQNPLLIDALNSSGTIHILGLLSSGGVHSHEDHILSLCKVVKNKKIIVHPFLDGRDTPPKSAKASLQKLQTICDEQPNVQIADVMGRFFAMDRDQRIERTQEAVDLLTKGAAKFSAPTALDALELAYARGETDEFIQPTKISNAKINDHDTVIFMNFRTDRVRQLCSALIKNLNINLVTLTEYDPKIPAKVLYPKYPQKNILSEVIANNKLKQLHIAETEKYAHVTFFFNAGRETPFEGEERIMIPSPKVATYDQSPAMSALAITDEIIKAIKNKSHDIIICNFANADMVGHTGKLDATIKAIEVLDSCLGNIEKALKEFGGQALITADHGNAEIMWNDEAQQAHTSHTSNLVPLVYIGDTKVRLEEGSFGLQDIAPSILQLLDIPKPNEMTGNAMFVL